MSTPRSRHSARQGPSNNLRTQFLTHALRSVVLPITLSGGIAFFLLTYLLDRIETNVARYSDAYVSDIARAELMTQASNAARQIDSFLIDRITEIQVWASTRVLADAALAAHTRHVAEGLTTTPTMEIKSRFRVAKSLDIAPEADEYLRRQIASSPYFIKLLVSDRNGFNVALTDPTSHFVHSEERWWQEAWNQGMALGDVEHDDSSGLWSIDISVRIDEHGTNDPIGVMLAVLAIEPIHSIADWTAQASRGGRVQITTGGGVLIAETASDHALQRIMNPDINLVEQGEPLVRAAFSSRRTGYAVDQDWLMGYARIGGPDSGSARTGALTDIDWIVILQKAVALVHKPANALRAIDMALHDWRRILGMTISAAVVLSALFAIALSSRAARRYASSLQSVREMAENAEQGRKVSPTVVVHPKEIAQLSDAVYRLSRVFNVVVNRRAEP